MPGCLPVDPKNTFDMQLINSARGQSRIDYRKQRYKEIRETWDTDKWLDWVMQLPEREFFNKMMKLHWISMKTRPPFKLVMIRKDRIFVKEVHTYMRLVLEKRGMTPIFLDDEPIFSPRQRLKIMAIWKYVEAALEDVAKRQKIAIDKAKPAQEPEVEGRMDFFPSDKPRRVAFYREDVLDAMIEAASKGGKALRQKQRDQLFTQELKSLGIPTIKSVKRSSIGELTRKGMSKA